MKAFILLLAVLMQSCIGYSQLYQGTWQGDLNIGATTLPFVLHLKYIDGQWNVTADSPNQGVKGIVGQATTKEDSLFVSLQGGIQIRGLLFGKDTIKADFNQNGLKLPLTLQRQGDVEEASKPLLRPQTPKPPYSYDTLDVKFQNNYDNIPLMGTLTFPKGGGQYPAVVLVTGSGPQNRNEELFGHQPFKVLADYLTRHGIVVLRYDDRGVGQSGGVFETSTIENFSKDAIAAFEFLKQQKQVDPQKVGIIGHSEGGLIAQLLAGQHVLDLSFIVSLAGPSISIDKLMVQQLYAIGKAEGMTELSLEIAKRINVKNFEVIKGGLDTKEAYDALLRNVGITSSNAQNTEIRTELLTMLAPAYRYFLRIEPEEYISQIKIPVFAAFGSLDVQVPANSNLKSLFDLLPKHPKTVLKEYEGLNHLFQPAKTGKVAEYMQIEETIDPQVLQDLTVWIKGL